MARSIAEIEAIIVAKANEVFPLITSTSKAAVWRLWVYVVAYVANLQDQVDDSFRAESEALAASQKVATLQWYRQQALNYLYGKALVWNEDKLAFEQQLTEDEEAADFTIVDYCAVVQSAQNLKVKVAKEAGGGGSEQLSGPEVTALATYLNQTKAAGDYLDIVNNPGDDLEMELDVYVDPLVIDVNTGYLIGAGDTVEVVDVAIRDFLRNLEFNGALVLTKLDDAVIAVDGVSDADRVSVTSRFGANPYAEIDVQQVPDAGHFLVNSINLNYYAKL